MFRPPLDMYDVLIRLTPRHIPRHRQAVDSPAASFCRGLLSEPGPSSLMPVLGYDPPQLYLAQLRVGLQGQLTLGRGLPGGAAAKELALRCPPAILSLSCPFLGGLWGPCPFLL